MRVAEAQGEETYGLGGCCWLLLTSESRWCGFIYARGSWETVIPKNDFVSRGKVGRTDGSWKLVKLAK